MTQDQREAVIDLLLLSIYSDSHISLTEEEALERTIAELGWDSTFPKDLFIQKAAPLARAASDSTEATKAFIFDRAARFTTSPAQFQAYNFVHQVLSPDGVAPPERGFLSLLSNAFPPAAS